MSVAMSKDRDAKLMQMKMKILRAEKENLKTRAKTSDQMVETIIKIIKKEADKNY